MRLRNVLAIGVLGLGLATPVLGKEPTPAPYFLTVYIYSTTATSAPAVAPAPTATVLPPFGPYGKKDDCLDADFAYVTACPANFGPQNCPAPGFGATPVCAQGFQTAPQQ
jgi:hypothetical protein